MTGIDCLAYGSRLSRANPFDKCLFAAAMLLVCLAAPGTPLSAVLVFISASCATVFKAGVPLRVYLTLLLAPAFFLCAGAAALLVDWVPSGGIALAPHGMHAALPAVTRGLGALSCLYFLALTTPLPDLLHVLRRLRLPELLIELAGLMYRCIFILLDAAAAIRTAQESRLGYAGLRNSYRSLGGLAAAVFTRSYFDAQQLSRALESRGGDGPLLVLQPGWTVRRGQTALIVALALALSAICFFAGSMP